MLTLVLAARWSLQRQQERIAEHNAWLHDLFEKAKPAPEPNPPAEDDPDADLPDGYDGPITVDAGELRRLIREALAGRPEPAPPVLPSAEPAAV